MNNTQHNTEEKEILNLVDAFMHDGSISATGEDADAYKKVFTLLSESRNTATPSADSLTALLAKLPQGTASAVPFTEDVAVKSPYRGTISWLYTPSSFKYTVPMVVVLFAAVIIAGTAGSGSDPLSIAPPKGDELVVPNIAPAVSSRIAPTTFSMASDPASGAAPRVMLMSKMSLTTVPSTTPQNVGELVALLSNEADGDVDLGTTDLDDPLLSVDQASVDAIQLPYDAQTI